MKKYSEEYADKIAPEIPVKWKIQDDDTTKINKGIASGYKACIEECQVEEMVEALKAIEALTTREFADATGFGPARKKVINVLSKLESK